MRVLVTISLFVIASLLTEKTVRGEVVGRIVVAHDANTLGTNLANDASEQFAVNVASFLTQNSANRLLLIETEPPFPSHDYSARVEEALLDAGFDLTVVDARMPLPDINDFDAVFVGIAARDDYATVSAEDFRSFILNGGGAYVYSGVGSNRFDEAAALNTLINDFGIYFITKEGNGNGGYNGLNGTIIDPTAHIIFAGISALVSSNGQWLDADTGIPGVQIIASVGEFGVYGVAEIHACIADLAPPFGLIDLDDVNAFTAGFLAQDPIADLNADGLFDLSDINLFVDSFLAGCP